MFGMHIYNDFNSYGIQELIEKLLSFLNDEFKKKEKDEQSLKKMWATSADLVHWLLVEQLGPWMMMDDGDRHEKTVQLIYRSFLTTISEIDRAGQLGNDTFAKDLDYGITWCKDIVAYAKKAKLDLVVTGCYGVKSRLEEIEEEHGNIKALANSKAADRWDWKKNFTAFAKSYGSKGKIGGDEYNILKFSRKERAKHAFDKKDPLAQFSEEELKSGNVMLG
ncbi:hypothetical protein E8E14_013268 [Neopestalotiopsis sp. 37M]|nr:hypothetical protein E8E14_013268 [Neopestalotiopsis sp. 37M]